MRDFVWGIQIIKKKNNLEENDANKILFVGKKV
jgi:hypothetical protein